MPLLVEFSIPCDLSTFVVFFLDQSFFSRFLSDKLEDLKVNVGEWRCDQESMSLQRNIKSFHPSKISFPGLPSHAESFKIQSLKIIHSNENKHEKDKQITTKLHMKEINSFKDIPYAEYFNVEINWNIHCTKNNTTTNVADYNNNNNDDDNVRLLSGNDSGNDIGNGNSEYACHVTIDLSFNFFYSTWLQSTIESNTRSELLDVYDI